MNQPYKELPESMDYDIPKVVDLLLSYQRKGELVCICFRNHWLYSDTVTLDRAYLEVTGNTRADQAVTSSFWIVAISDSHSDGVYLQHTCGTLEDIKQRLWEAMLERRGRDETFDYGTESIEDMEVSSDDMYAYDCYADYHIDYTAMKLADIPAIKR